MYDTIKMNKLPLFRQKNSVKSPKSKLQVLSLKSDCHLSSSLFITSQAREANFDNFLAHENHAYPVALSEYGNLRKTDTYLFVQCLEELQKASYEELKHLAMIAIDGAAFVHMNPPRQSKTLQDYCGLEIVDKIKKAVNGVERLDLVFDVYREDSSKAETRDCRESSVRVSVMDTTPIVKDFKRFLRHNDNKTELFCMIADKVSECLNDVSATIICTKLSEVVINSAIDLVSLLPCNHEEADTRIFVHVNDAANVGRQYISIKTVDTDVVVIAVGIFFELHIAELWIEYGAGRKRRWLPIHIYAKYLGKEKCMALLFWYAFTGCDTVSSFNSCGKKTA